MTRGVEVLLLTQDNCQFCEHAKAVLGRLGDEVPLTVRTMDLRSQPGRRLAETLGVMFAPGIVIDGELFSLSVDI